MQPSNNFEAVSPAGGRAVTSAARGASEQAHRLPSYRQEVVIRQGTQRFFKHILGNCLWGREERKNFTRGAALPT